MTGVWAVRGRRAGECEPTAPAPPPAARARPARRRPPSGRGRIRRVGAVGDASWAAGAAGATVVHLEP